MGRGDVAVCEHHLVDRALPEDRGELPLVPDLDPGGVEGTREGRGVAAVGDVRDLGRGEGHDLDVRPVPVRRVEDVEVPPPRSQDDDALSPCGHRALPSRPAVGSLPRGVDPRRLSAAPASPGGHRKNIPRLPRVGGSPPAGPFPSLDDPRGSAREGDRGMDGGALLRENRISFAYDPADLGPSPPTPLPRAPPRRAPRAPRRLVDPHAREARLRPPSRDAPLGGEDPGPLPEARSPRERTGPPRLPAREPPRPPPRERPARPADLRRPAPRAAPPPSSKGMRLPSLDLPPTALPAGTLHSIRQEAMP